jgi:hypothetical protein
VRRERRLVRRAVSSGTGERLLRALERAEPRRENLLRVLTYHRVTRDVARYRTTYRNHEGDYEEGDVYIHWDKVARVFSGAF